jgi:signal transduction histidine kinase
MFQNVSVSTKLLVLCCIVLLTFGVTTYSLLAEKQLALDFTRKELVGNRYIENLRKVYTAVLAGEERRSASNPDPVSIDAVLEILASADAQSGGSIDTAGLHAALASALRELWSRSAQGADSANLTREALRKTRDVILRVGDESNLTLDPDLDSYYLQDLVVTKIPALLGYLAELQSLAAESYPAPNDSGGRASRIIILEGFSLAGFDGVRNNLDAVYRVNEGGDIRAVIDDPFANMLSAGRLYLGSLAAQRDRSARQASTGLLYENAVNDTLAAWESAQHELGRVLQRRIDGLLANLRSALALIGALVALSMLVAFLAYRNIVKPLQRFEAVANKVRQTKDYGLRVDVTSRDEIGRLAGAFNEMLSELSDAREREHLEQAELARVTRAVTMGAMTASIAHEVNQPLAAIVANGNAATRWLALPQPDIDEANAALKRIVKDGHRASQVIASVRAMFKKEQPERAWLAVNDLVREVLQLVQANLQGYQAAVVTDLAGGLPEVLVDRVQLQQVLINLVNNGAEAMAQVPDRERTLTVTTGFKDDEVLIMVADTGPGIGPDQLQRIFEPFFTTKADGMGLGLAICRSIVEAHGGRLWVTASALSGTTFHVALPSRPADQ